MPLTLIWLATIILFIVGLAGIFVPLLPGIALVFIGILVFAIGTNMTEIGPVALTIFGLITVLTWLADYVGSGIGARLGGGSLYAVSGTIIGGIIGLLTVGPLGLLAGAALGAFGGALYEGQNQEQALKTAALSIVGVIGAAFVQFAIALMMIISFLLLVAT